MVITIVTILLMKSEHVSISRSFSLCYRGTFLGVYAALGFSQALLVLLGSFALAIGAIFASKTLHDKMLESIMRSPMSTTPLGRILNRFSKDIYTVDESIPRSLRAFLMSFSSVISIIIVILIATPIFLAVIAPLGVVYFLIQVLGCISHLGSLKEPFWVLSGLFIRFHLRI